MIMEILQGVLLGAVQGLTEFFPVSSSGHLIFVPVLFGWKDQGVAFDTVVHGGTLVAVITVLRKELYALCTKAIKNHAPSQRLLAQVLVAAIPGLIIGFLAKDVVQGTLRSAYAVAISMAGWAIMLWIADYWRSTHKATVTDRHDITWTQALIVGVLQSVAIIPGTSRSGITMTGGLFSGMDRKTAVLFSFLLSIPTIAAAFGYGVLRVIQDGPGTGGFGMFIAGFVAAAITGFWAIRFLYTYVSTHSFRPFVWYRLVLAALILFLLT